MKVGGVAKLLGWVVDVGLDLLEVKECESDLGRLIFDRGRLLVEEEHVFSISPEYLIECRDCLPVT